MQKFITFKRTALLMLMCMAAAWCLPVRAQQTVNGYTLYGLTGDDYWDVNSNSMTTYCSIGKPEGAPENLYLLFKMDYASEAKCLQFLYNGQNSADNQGSLFFQVPTDGGFQYELRSQNPQGNTGSTFRYTISLFDTEDQTADPLAVFSGSYEFLQLARFSVSPARIVGEPNEAIPFTVTIEANGVAGKEAAVKFARIADITIACDELTDQNLQYNWSFPIPSLQDATYHFTLTSTAEKQVGTELRLEDNEGKQLKANYNWMNINIPFNVSLQDIAGLEKIANDNDNAFLREYIAKEGYTNSENDSIQIYWDESVTPARINNLNLMIRSLTTVDVSAFDSLRHLTIQNAPAVKTLDLSMLKNLQEVGLWNMSFTSLSQVTLPDNPGLIVRGTSNFPLGQKKDEYTYQLASGETVDLSGYLTIDGEPATIKWMKRMNGNEIEQQWEQTAPGVFVVPQPDEADKDQWVRYWCEITTEKYPEWKTRSYDIELVRGAIEYSASDIQVLKDLAAANPDCEEWQQFIAAEGWTEAWPESFWQDQNRKVAVDWSYDTPARISQLRVRNMGTVKNLDLSALDRLTYLDISELYDWKTRQGIETLDLTKNTKLRTLEANNNQALQTLNLSGLSALENVYVGGDFKLKALDLTASKATLIRLELTNCNDFTLDLTQFTNLYYLRLNGTEQYAAYIAKLPQSIRELFCEETEYPLIDFTAFPNLTAYGVPMGVEQLDVTRTNINRLEMSNSRVRYSTYKGASNVGIGGGSILTIPGLTEWEGGYNKNIPMYTIAAGDTVDLSSEAMVGDIPSRYVWVDNWDRTESTGVFTPVDGKPGVFVYQGNGRINETYHCIVSNEKYCLYSEINEWSGWRMETGRIVIPEPQATYDTAEVAALKAIVDNTDSPALKQWWDNEEWKTGNSSDGRFFAAWRFDEATYTYHLGHLRFSGLQDTLKTLDISAFTELTDFNCEANSLTALSLKANGKLMHLQVNNCPLETLVLPDVKENLETVYLLWNSLLESIDVSGYTNLRTLNLRGDRALASVGDLSQLANLEYLWLNETQVEPVVAANHPKLRVLGVPAKTTSIDASGLDSLETLDVDGSMLRFSTVKLKEGTNCFVNGQTYLSIGGFRSDPHYSEYQPFYLFPADAKIQLGTEMQVGNEQTYLSGTARNEEGSHEISFSSTDNKEFTIQGAAIHDRIEIQLFNWAYDNWTVRLQGQIYSRDGDANLDQKVDVRDVPVTVNYIIGSPDGLPWERFGFHEADVNYDGDVNAVDIQGIINLILGKSVTKSSELRADYLPAVELSVENGILYMDAETAVASLQLELTGMTEAEPFLAKAAALTQASTVGDTTRIVGYSLKGATIPAGKSALMKFPAGARLAKAVFADEKAQPLEVRTKGDIATSNETIRVAAAGNIANYPNPFRTTTTLVYSLDEEVDRACVQVYSFNGVLLDVVEGLGTAAGENRFCYSTRLASGTYLYRLMTQKGGKTTYSKSNTFIIK